MPQRSSLPVGIILSNMGSPSAPTPAAVRDYLREFLSDPAIVDLPRLLWLPILHGIILRTRPQRVARLYASVWTDAGAPLVAIARRQAAALQESLGRAWTGRSSSSPGCAMAAPPCATPSMPCGAGGARTSFSCLSTPNTASRPPASTIKAAGPLALEHPEMRIEFARNYHDHPGYIGALAASVREFQVVHGKPDRLLLSFHGMPASSVAKGDPYYEQCKERLPSSPWRSACNQPTIARPSSPGSAPLNGFNPTRTGY